jgi:hypothetical protein
MIGRILVAVTGVLLVAATVAAYAARALGDSDRFADRAAVALQHPDVRSVIADRVTDDVILRANADLIAARPIITSAVSGLVGGDAFAGLFRRGVRDLHAAVFRRDQDTVTLTIVDLATVLAAALEVVDPELAAELQSRRPPTVLNEEIVGADVLRATGVLAWLLPALALVTACAAVAFSPDRRRTVFRLGLAAVVAGLVVVAAETIAQGVALKGVGEDERAAASAVWDAFLGDLGTAGWVLAACGAIVSAAAASLLRPLDVDRPVRVAWRALVTEPASTPARVARGAALVGAGVLVLVQPLVLPRLVALYLLFRGLDALLRVIDAPGAPRVRLRRASAVAAVTLLLALTAGALVAGGGIDAPAAVLSGCNGHVELCDRPLNEVTLAATHNSMSVPLPGWFSALQDRPIVNQLDAGIRGLLFDTHYADRLPNGRVRTDFDGPEELGRALQQDSVNENAVAAARRLRERAGFRGEGERGMYLCHTFCELGATPLASVLEDIHAFLVNHPNEVLVVINQDFVSPTDFVGALDAAGLTRYAFAPPRETPWPTLRELIERDQRLVVLAENHAGTAPFYQLAYERLTHETPFSFATAAELTTPATLAATCRPNRGPERAPLFLVNHWVNTDPAPRPSNAALVNAYAPLLERARTCERTRGARVNLLAVDFYARGDVLAVVDTLNGVGDG